MSATFDHTMIGSEEWRVCKTRAGKSLLVAWGQLAVAKGCSPRQTYKNALLQQESMEGADDLSKWTLSLLRDFCQRHGLKKSGKKEDVLTR